MEIMCVPYRTSYPLSTNLMRLRSPRSQNRLKMFRRSLSQNRVQKLHRSHWLGLNPFSSFAFQTDERPRSDIV